MDRTNEKGEVVGGTDFRGAVAPESSKEKLLEGDKVGQIIEIALDERFGVGIAFFKNQGQKKRAGGENGPNQSDEAILDHDRLVLLSFLNKKGANFDPRGH